MRDTIKQAGFTLVEMAVVILIAGLITGAVFAFYTPYIDSRNRQITIDRENKIARALADFAERTGKLPCPGRPEEPDTTFGNEGACTYLSGSGTSIRAEGIVPFRALGLSLDDIYDGYSNLFTYAITPGLMQAFTVTDVHKNCRIATPVTPTWIDGGNLNPLKAVFCCQRPDSLGRLEIFRDPTARTPAFYAANVQLPPTTPPGSEFQHFDTSASPNATNTDNLAYFAYVIVSHGKNAQGIYIRGRNASFRSVPASTPEAENADNRNPVGNNADIQYVAIPYSQAPGNEYFDDIVLWRTQQGVMRELGNNSCSRP